MKQSARPCPTPLVVLSLAGLATAPAHADPCSGGGDGDYENAAGAAPSPAAETAVRMLSEVVDFVESPSGASWLVRAHYVFENDRDRAIRLSLIFPWAPADRYCSVAALLHGDGGPPGGDSELLETWVQRRELEGNGFVARIDGQPTEVRLDRAVTCAGGGQFPFGHTFRMEFPPQSTRTLDLEYTQVAGPHTHTYGGGGCPCHGVSFILSTGALWRGTIGELTLRYVLAAPTTLIGLGERIPFPEDYQDGCLPGRLETGARTVAGVPFSVTLECRDNATTVTLTARDAEPTGIVSLAVHGPQLRRRLLGWQGCRLDPATEQPVSDCCRYASRPLVVPKQEAEDTGLSLDGCFVDRPGTGPAVEEGDAAAGGDAAADAVQDAAADAVQNAAADAVQDAAADAVPDSDGGAPTTQEAGTRPTPGDTRPVDRDVATTQPTGRSRHGCSAAGAPRGGLLQVLAVLSLAAVRRRSRRPRDAAARNAA
jgi:hypothetical protein